MGAKVKVVSGIAVLVAVLAGIYISSGHKEKGQLYTESEKKIIEEKHKEQSEKFKQYDSSEFR